MLLDEAEGSEQVAAALDIGDPELERDVRLQIRDLVQSGWSHASTEWDDLDEEELVTRVEQYFDGDLMGLAVDLAGHDADVDRVLQTIPDQHVKDALRAEVEKAAERTARWIGGRGVPTALPRPSTLFEFEGGQGGGIRIGPIHHSINIRIAEPLSWVPSGHLVDLLKDEGPYKVDWEEYDEDAYSTGWFESDDQLRMVVKREDAVEWAQDLRQDYYSELIDADPAEATRALLSELERLYPELARKVRKAKLPKDVLADYAVAYFQDREEGIEILSEAMGVFGYEGSNAETILEIDKDILRQLGVHHGRWEHGAPWRLADLPPEELAYEGTLMRHCVGRHGMGYREAVERGDTAIWSLRSRFERPLLTFEVNLPAWKTADETQQSPGMRGRAIVQLKGKLNRPAGVDADEAAVLGWVFDQLGVDPREVQGFAPARAANPAGSFCAPWRPYRERVAEAPRAVNPRFAARRQRLTRV